jgi:CheY-like chemotaxis protein
MIRHRQVSGQTHLEARATVLLVEDDALVNELVADIMREQGYQVLTAANAEEALALMELHAGIAVLFTDIGMPGPIDGIALAWLASRSRPHMRIIIASSDTRQVALPMGSTTLPKPYSGRQIAETLRVASDQTSRLAS